MAHAGQCSDGLCARDVVQETHDEAQIECPKDIAEEVGKAFRQSIIEAGEFYKLRCPLDGEYKIGRNWRETH